MLSILGPIEYEQACGSSTSARQVLHFACFVISLSWSVCCGWYFGGAADDWPYHASAGWFDGAADRARVWGTSGSGLDSWPLCRPGGAGSAGCPAKARVGGGGRSPVA